MFREDPIRKGSKIIGYKKKVFELNPRGGPIQFSFKTRNGKTLVLYLKTVSEVIPGKNGISSIKDSNHLVYECLDKDGAVEFTYMAPTKNPFRYYGNRDLDEQTLTFKNYGYTYTIFCNNDFEDVGVHIYKNGKKIQTMVAERDSLIGGNLGLVSEGFVNVKDQDAVFLDTTHNRVIQYAGTLGWMYDEQASEPTKLYLTAYCPGDTVWAAMDKVVMREDPNIRAKIITTLPFGGEVTVLERSAGDLVNVSGRIDHWYKVQQKSGKVGYVFGGGLTSVMVPVSSPNNEMSVTLSWRNNFDLCVRVFHAGKVSADTLRLDGKLNGGAARAFLIENTSQVPLLVVEAECASTHTRHYYSYKFVNGEAVILLDTYARNSESAAYGYLLFEPDGRHICSGFASYKKLVSCRNVADGKRADLPKDTSGWRKIPAKRPKGMLVEEENQ